MLCAKYATGFFIFFFSLHGRMSWPLQCCVKAYVADSITSDAVHGIEKESQRCSDYVGEVIAK